MNPFGELIYKYKLWISCYFRSKQNKKKKKLTVYTSYKCNYIFMKSDGKKNHHQGGFPAVLC